jgi:AraC-like DNA-binding protein
MRRSRLFDPDDELERIPYWPMPPRSLGAQVFSMRTLRSRVPAEHLRRPHRIEFHLLICVTRGTCTHVMDFNAVHCKPGSVLIFHPGQTEKFDLTSSWDGSLVLFRPELLFAPLTSTLPSKISELNLISILARLPQHFTLSGFEFRRIRNVLAQMHADSKLNVPAPHRHALLRHQICALLIRLDMAHPQHESRTPAADSEILRFRRLQQLLDDSFQRWHDVAKYANALGCTEKTLTRTTLSVAGVTAKTFIASRICAEVKRLLVHTSLSVAAISDRVGFNDPSNFVKFFKREAECTPLEFRRHHQAK